MGMQAHSPMVQLQFMASITRVLGQETWFNCVSLLTHGCTAPPDTPSGAPMDYHRSLEMRKRDLSMQLRYGCCPCLCVTSEYFLARSEG